MEVILVTPLSADPILFGTSMGIMETFSAGCDSLLRHLSGYSVYVVWRWKKLDEVLSGRLRRVESAIFCNVLRSLRQKRDSGGRFNLYADVFFVCNWIRNALAHPVSFMRRLLFKSEFCNWHRRWQHGSCADGLFSPPPQPLAADLFLLTDRAIRPAAFSRLRLPHLSSESPALGNDRSASCDRSPEDAEWWREDHAPERGLRLS